MTNNTTAALTDEQINAIANDGHRNVAGGIYAHHVHDFARDVERALVTAPRAGLPRHVLASLECTAVWLEKGNDPQDAARELRACLAKIDAAPAAPVAEAEPQWLPINFAPDDDELIWLMKGDSIEGPRRIHPNDYDRYTHYAPCEAPSIKSVRAQAVAADGDAIDTKAIAESLERMIVDWYADCERTRLDWKQMAGVIKLRLDRFLKRAAVSPATADSNCTLIPLSERHPVADEHPRVIVFTDGSDFNGAQFFDVSADTLNECFYESPDEQPEVGRHATHWMPRPSLHSAAPATADERADWSATRHSLAIAIAAFGTRPDGRRGTDAAAQMLESITEPGSPLSWLRASQAAAPADAREPECPRCNGSGDAIAYSDNGPDATEEAVNCPHCNGHGTLAEAYAGVVAALEKANNEYLALCGKQYFAPADAGEAVAPDPIAALIARHAEELDWNDYAYFELAYTRQTGWMAWITDKPLQGPVLNPDRKVLARGQGATPAEACRDALSTVQGAQGGKGGEA
ncbi:hypothetical protein [Burkholderia gladioli]|uniref:hypothetical protein n=1 Tax=Burkholderia gladioli TaxID=28095 RepID=UPI001ABAA5B0|nr:hypothetical protein [Burkholderia gladioli]